MCKLNSDFKDYYDAAFKKESQICYNRFKSTGRGRAEALTYLKSLGIPTIKFGAFSSFDYKTPEFVVYTNPKLHDGLGKYVYSFYDVATQYRNYLVAEHAQGTQGYTLKYLQIGERRFKLTLHNPNYKNVLSEGKVVGITELEKGYNFNIRLPIYSIDYVVKDRMPIAIDFNEVQELSRLGMDTILSAEEVVNEVKKALIAYSPDIISPDVPLGIEEFNSLPDLNLLKDAVEGVEDTQADIETTIETAQTDVEEGSLNTPELQDIHIPEVKTPLE